MKYSRYLIFFLLVTGACGISPDKVDPGKITSISIIDQNGMSETISSKDRLTGYDKTDFFAPQPYQKVMRVYGREKNGDVHSCITSYHPNGQIKQYLEAINNRAYGVYKEWYSNGQLKIEAYLIGGSADLNNKAEESWIFEGISKAYNEDGKKIAEISYVKGELEGKSYYYHPNGKTWKISPYEKDLLNGIEEIFLEDGSLFQTNDFVKGMKEGLSSRFWDDSTIAYQEEYKANRLLEAVYLGRDGNRVSEIHQGYGQRAVFGKKNLIELQEYKNGLQEGKVKVFDEKGHLIRLYSIKEGEKNGEEIDYYPDGLQNKMLLTWQNGYLLGSVKTWYENGNLESQKEMSQNQKNGLLTAWYEDGCLMLVEEYENDKLLKGEYFRRGEKIPSSVIEKGRGIATLFSRNGDFSGKVHYQDGKPTE